MSAHVIVFYIGLYPPNALSLDTLDPFKFEIMTRRMGHEAVLKALEVALSLPGLQSVKLNAVIIKGLNDLEVPQFVEMTKEQPISVRFIEFMPFTGKACRGALLVVPRRLANSLQATSGTNGNFSHRRNCSRGSRPIIRES